MILIGDIGNTDTKICLINLKYKIIKKLLSLQKKSINWHYLKVWILLKIKEYI